jgi:hypothetical protein
VTTPASDCVEDRGATCLDGLPPPWRQMQRQQLPAGHQRDIADVVGRLHVEQEPAFTENVRDVDNA